MLSKEIISCRGDVSHFMGAGLSWIDLDPTDIGCWRLTLTLFGLGFLPPPPPKKLGYFKSDGDETWQAYTMGRNIYKLIKIFMTTSSY